SRSFRHGSRIQLILRSGTSAQRQRQKGKKFPPSPSYCPVDLTSLCNRQSDSSVYRHVSREYGKKMEEMQHDSFCPSFDALSRSSSGIAYSDEYSLFTLGIILILCCYFIWVRGKNTTENSFSYAEEIVLDVVDNV